MLIVATVFKKGEKTDPANYRPVVLTSHLIKIHKRIVRKRVMAFLVDKTLSHSPDCKMFPFKKGFKKLFYVRFGNCSTLKYPDSADFLDLQRCN